MLAKYLRIALFFIISSLLVFSLEAKQIVEERGGKVKVVKYFDDTWELLSDNKPYFIKGVMFTPVKIGESPDNATMRDWMYYDDNKNGKNDIAFETWLDKNNNNQRDPDETIQGDFSFLKEIGVNTIRLYHVASDNPILGDIYKKSLGTALQFDHAVNKELLNKLYSNYGIKVIMGNFLGAWTIGSGASWEEGTDYTNPKHCENIKKSVRAMVLDNKDEPYVLLWVLGNENNVADWGKCNAKTQPEAYAKLVGQLADMIHELDPNHPVAICDGDSFNLLPYYAKYATSLDIISYNSYRSKAGFGALWRDSKAIFDRPIFIGECGMFAYNKNIGEDQNMQLEYVMAYWYDIVENSSYYPSYFNRGIGNSLGGVIFDWLDRWYRDGKPSEHNIGTKPWPSPDGLDHEEWFGLMSMGNGKDTLMRQKRRAAYFLQEVWP